MARAHLYRPITNSSGDVLPNTVVRVLQTDATPSLATAVSATVYGSKTGTDLIGATFTATTGVIDLWMDDPQFVTLGLTPPGKQEYFITNVPVVGPQASQGPKGDTGPKGSTGPQGPQGIQGIQGIQGTKGDKGDVGDTGPTGARGATGATGPKGDLGNTGADAYTLAVANGYVGTQAQWIASLKGSTGAQGLKGDTGVQGPQGAQGIPGAVGATGPTGATGPMGPKGDPGAQGLQGLTGATGPTGSQGPIGLTGATGPQGVQGLTGATGPKGDTGSQGLQGATGPIGLTGATGAQGPKGDTGIQGLPGATGATGPKGDTGAQGLQGLTGAQGPKGDTGAQGLPGATGAQGVKGDTGLTGPTGPTGPQGLQGLQGATGAQGLKGDPGATGATGLTGATGPQGPAGPATTDASLLSTGTLPSARLPMITSDKIADLSAIYATTGVAAGKVDKGSMVFNVADYGAKGDGTTDDSPAAQAAANAIKANGGGVLLFPSGKTYRLGAGVDLSSNVTVDFTGATLRKLGPVADYYVFRAGSKGAVDGASNLVFRGGIIRGSFSSGTLTGASITLNKARHVRFENITFTETMLSGHALDLGGCNGVDVVNCVFEGWSPQGTNYVEAIQVDVAYRDGNAVDDGYNGSYDGEPSRNINVRGCKFIPLVISGTTYPAPNPIGAHARVQNTYIENINFEDNYVLGCRLTSDSGPGFDTYIRGWIHFTHSKNVRIARNTFVNTGSVAARVIGCDGFGTGTLLTDVATVGPVSQTITPCPSLDWVIAENTFRGFKSSLSTEPLIRITGHPTGPVYAKGIEVRDNYVEDSCAVLNDASNTGSTFAQISWTDDVKIVNNRVREIRILADVDNSLGVEVSGNRVNRTSWTVCEINACSDVVLGRNKVAAHAGGYHVVASFDVTISDNRLRYMSPVTTSTPNLYQAHMSISSTESVLVHHNNLSGTVARGIYAYTNSKRGRVESNIVLGATTPVDLASTTITDWIQSGTVSA